MFLFLSLLSFIVVVVVDASISSWRGRLGKPTQTICCAVALTPVCQNSRKQKEKLNWKLANTCVFATWPTADQNWRPYDSFFLFPLSLNFYSQFWLTQIYDLRSFFIRFSFFILLGKSIFHFLMSKCTKNLPKISLLSLVLTLLHTFFLTVLSFFSVYLLLSLLMKWWCFFLFSSF